MSTEPKRVSPEEAQRMVEEEGYTLVDVRTEAEWALGHPKGAPNVPFMFAGARGMIPNADFLRVMRELYPKETKLIMSCKSGGRSLKAARELAGAGFENIADVRSGWDGVRNAFGQVTEPGWSQAGLPHETETKGASYAELLAKAFG